MTFDELFFAFQQFIVGFDTGVWMVQLALYPKQRDRVELEKEMLREMYENQESQKP